MDLVDLSEEAKAKYSGETHFRRGLAYSVLAETSGGVPIILTDISTEEARSLKRASLEETWQQALDDYEVAITNLGVDAPEPGRATKGAALRYGNASSTYTKVNTRRFCLVSSKLMR